MTPNAEVALIPTYTVISRHSATCADKAKGRSHVRCGCRKHIAVYDPNITDSKKRQSLIKTKTRSWHDAERIAQAHRDRHDPDKVRAAKAEAELEALRNKQQAESAVATIEEAVAKFLVYEYNNPRRKSNQRSGKAAKSTMKTYEDLIGTVISENGAYVVKRNGRLFAWLKTLPQLPLYISDLTPTLVDEFRASWNNPIPGNKHSKPYNDLTAKTAFTRLKTFFDYCKTRGKWIAQNPLDGVPLPTADEGYRTAPFTDSQYDSITAVIKNRYPGEIKNSEDQKRYEDTHRLLAFIELMRWGGLALADAVQFELSSMKDNGHVEYRRVKTNNKAKPTLPAWVVSRLREVVPIDADLNRPFYDKGIKPESNRGRWSRWAKELFAEAGIGTVATEIRDREPHCHMMRDTFAVSQLRMQKKLGIVDIHGIAKAMGDSEATVRKHYTAWVDELESAYREAQQRIVEAQAREQSAKQPQQPKLVEIGGRR
jgi:hypothetical protein